MVFGNFNRGERLEVLLYGDECPRAGEVMWSRDDFIGVRFEDPCVIEGARLRPNS